MNHQKGNGDDARAHDSLGKLIINNIIFILNKNNLMLKLYYEMKKQRQVAQSAINFFECLLKK